MRHLWNQLGEALDRCGMGGWLLLLAGVGLIGITLLTPPWLDVQALAAQRRILARYSYLVHQRDEDYQAFVSGLRSGDPQLLQRVAWNQLHLKPANAALLDQSPEDLPAPVGSPSAYLPPVEMNLPLHLRPYTPPQTRLIRLTTGRTRPWMMAVGGLLILGGLLSDPAQADSSACA